MSERSRPSNPQKQPRDYSSSKRKEYAEPSLSQLTEQAEQALQYNDSGVQSKDLVRVSGAITSARAFIGSTQNQDSLSGPSRRTFKATYSSYDPVARRQRESREQGEDVFAALGQGLEEASGWLRDLLTEPYKDTKAFISDTQRKKAEQSLALPAYSAPTYDPIPEHLGSTKQLWKMAPPPPKHRQIPYAELPQFDPDEEERHQRNRQRTAQEEDRSLRQSGHHNGEERRERVSRDPVHRRRSEELRDTRSPSHRKSRRQDHNSSDEDDIVDMHARPARRRRIERDQYPEDRRYRSQQNTVSDKQRSPSRQGAGNYRSFYDDRSRTPRREYSAAPPLIPMHQHVHQSPGLYSQAVDYSAPPARSATIPPGYLPAALPVTNASQMHVHSSYDTGTWPAEPKDDFDYYSNSNPTYHPANPASYNTQTSFPGILPSQSIFTQKMQAAIEQQRLPPIRNYQKASQAFVAAYDAHDAYTEQDPGNIQRQSTLDYILNQTSPDTHIQVTPPPRCQTSYIVPQSSFSAQGFDYHHEPGSQDLPPYHQLKDASQHSQDFAGPADQGCQHEQHFAFSAPQKASQSYPIAINSETSPLQDSDYHEADQFAAHANPPSALAASPQNASAQTMAMNGPVRTSQPSTLSPHLSNEIFEHNKPKIILPDRSEPGWHPPLKPAEKRRLEREASRASQPSPTNYQSSSAKSSFASAKPVKASMAHINVSLGSTDAAKSNSSGGPENHDITPSGARQWQPVKIASMANPQAGIDYTHPKGEPYIHKENTPNQTTASIGQTRPVNNKLARTASRSALRPSGSITPMKVTPIRPNTRSTINKTNVPKAVKASSSSAINASDSIDDEDGPITPSNAEAVPAFFRNNKTKLNF